MLRVQRFVRQHVLACDVVSLALVGVETARVKADAYLRAHLPPCAQCCKSRNETVFLLTLVPYIQVLRIQSTPTLRHRIRLKHIVIHTHITQERDRPRPTPSLPTKGGGILSPSRGPRKIYDFWGALVGGVGGGQFPRQHGLIVKIVRLVVTCRSERPEHILRGLIADTVHLRERNPDRFAIRPLCCLSASLSERFAIRRILRRLNISLTANEVSGLLSFSRRRSFSACGLSPHPHIHACPEQTGAQRALKPLRPFVADIQHRCHLISILCAVATCRELHVLHHRRIDERQPLLLPAANQQRTMHLYAIHIHHVLIKTTAAHVVLAAQLVVLIHAGEGDEQAFYRPARRVGHHAARRGIYMVHHRRLPLHATHFHFL